MKVTSDPAASGNPHAAASGPLTTPPTPDAASSVGAGALTADAAPVPPDLAAPPSSSASGNNPMEGAGYDWADWMNLDETDVTEASQEQEALLDALGTIETADANVQMQVLLDVLEATMPLLPTDENELTALVAQTADKLGLDRQNMSIFDLIALLLVMSMDANIKNSRVLAQGAAQSATSRMENVLAEVQKMNEKADKGLDSAGTSFGISIAIAFAAGAASVGGAKLQARFDANKANLAKIDKAIQATDRQAAGAMMKMEKDPSIVGGYSDEMLEAGLAAREAGNAKLGLQAAGVAAAGVSGQAVAQAATGLQQASDQTKITTIEGDIREQQALGQSDADLQQLESKGAESSTGLLSETLRGNASTVNAVSDAMARTVV